MPYTLNGVGTHYYGKRNVYIDHGTCEHCGKPGELKSYDTTNYFVVLFVPLIPLGKKRILSYCPSCTRHAALPLNKWEEMKRKSFEEKLTAYKQNPNDSEVAKEALGTIIGFHDRQTFLKVAPAVKDNFKENADMQQLLGELYMGLGQPADGAECLQRAYDLDSKPERAERAAVALMQSGRPGDAAPLLSHIKENKDAQKLGYYILLTEAFQAEGNHKKALEALATARDLEPAIEKDKSWKKLKKVSEKNQASGKAIKSKKLDAVSAIDDVSRDSGGKAAAIIWPTIILGIFAVYLWLSYSAGQSRQGFLVGGLSQPYSVEVAGQKYTVRPGRRTQFAAPDGSYNLKVVDGPYDIPNQAFTVKTNFWSRIADAKTVIVNPDGAAVIAWTKGYYYDPGTPEAEMKDNEVTLYGGELLYTLETPDYIFEEFEQEIEVDSSRNEVAKTQLELWSDGRMSEGELLFSLMSYGENGMEQVIDVAKNRATYDSSSQVHLSFLSSMLGVEEFTKEAQPFLAERPIRTDWHRAYQSMMLREEGGRDKMIAEYAPLLADEPENGTLHYLMGRIQDDPLEQKRFFEQAVAFKDATGMAQYALGSMHLMAGDGQAAYPLLKGALEMRPGDEQIENVLIDAMLASGRHDEAIAIGENKARQTAPDPGWTANVAGYHFLAGNRDLAQETITKYLARIKNNTSESFQAEAEKMLRGSYALFRGDEKSYEMYGPDYEDENYQFTLALLKKDLVAAEETYAILEEYEDVAVDEPALLYMLFRLAGNQEKADLYLQKVIEMLAESSDADDQRMRAWLAGEQPLDLERLRWSYIDLAQKRTFAAALAFVYPDQAAALFNYVERLNIDPWRPRSILIDILASARERLGISQ